MRQNKMTKWLVGAVLAVLAVVVLVGSFSSAKAETAYIKFQNNDWCTGLSNADYSFLNDGGTTQWCVAKYEVGSNQFKGEVWPSNNQTVTLELNGSYYYWISFHGGYPGYHDGSTSGYTHRAWMLEVYKNGNWYWWPAWTPGNGWTYEDWRITGSSVSNILID